MLDQPGELGASNALIEPLPLLSEPSLEPGTPVQDCNSSRPGGPFTAGPKTAAPESQQPSSWLEAAGNVIDAFPELAVEQHAHQHHHRKDRANAKAKREHETASECSAAESVTGRSHSYSSGYDSSSRGSHSSSGSVLGTSLSCSAASSCHGDGCGARPKSFTVGQLQAHKHRLASSTAARSSSPPLNSSSHGTRCAHQHTGGSSCSGRACNKCGAQRQRPSISTAGGLRKEGSGSQTSAAGKPLTMSFSGGAYCAGDVRLLSSSPGGLPQRGLLLAESASVEEVGKGFRSRWYCSNRVLQVYNGSMPAESQLLLKHVPHQPGLYLWLVKPPCSRQWVPVRLAGADDLRQALSECLHADGSCGPLGSKQRVLLDLQCRGFAVQVRYRPLKPSCGDVQSDLLCKLQRYDFALNDTDNNGCRPIELPDGRPVYSYPLVVGHMMRLFEHLFVQPRFV